ncbi:MAG: hypothetical protein ACOYD0_03875 [Candidatus Nanopelagicales bacterium]
MDESADNDAMLLDVRIPAPIDEVWLAFREPALIRQWHGWQYSGLDEEIEFIYQQGTLAEETSRTLLIGAHAFSLVPSEDQAETLIRMTRRQATIDPAAAGVDLEAFRDEIEAGWLSFLQQLRFYFAFHRGETRDTLNFSGDSTAPVPAPITKLLKLESVAGDRVHPEYRAQSPSGPLTGEVWFHTGSQIGLVVNEWGPGLALFTYPPRAVTRYGSLTATLTTYEMSAAALEDLDQKWSQWWSANFKPVLDPQE